MTTVRPVASLPSIQLVQPTCAKICHLSKNANLSIKQYMASQMLTTFVLPLFDLVESCYHLSQALAAMPFAAVEITKMSFHSLDKTRVMHYQEIENVKTHASRAGALFIAAMITPFAATSYGSNYVLDQYKKIYSKSESRHLDFQTINEIWEGMKKEASGYMRRHSKVLGVIGGIVFLYLAYRTMNPNAMEKVCSSPQSCVNMRDRIHKPENSKKMNRVVEKPKFSSSTSEQNLFPFPLWQHAQSILEVSYQASNDSLLQKKIDKPETTTFDALNAIPIYLQTSFLRSSLSFRIAMTTFAILMPTLALWGVKKALKRCQNSKTRIGVLKTESRKRKNVEIDIQALQIDQNQDCIKESLGLEENISEVITESDHSDLQKRKVLVQNLQQLIKQYEEHSKISDEQIEMIYQYVEDNRASMLDKAQKVSSEELGILMRFQETKLARTHLFTKNGDIYICFKKHHSKYKDKLLALGGDKRLNLGIDPFTLKKVGLLTASVGLLEPKSKKIEFEEKYKNEVQQHQMLSHIDGIVQLFGYISYTHKYCKKFTMVVEYCEHGDLDDLIDSYQELKKIPLTSEQKAKIARKLSVILNEMHKCNIVHQDIKMKNILLDKSYNPRICDFACVIENDEKIGENHSKGTAGYLPPEDFDIEDMKRITAKKDVWALGIVFMRMKGLVPSWWDDQYGVKIENLKEMTDKLTSDDFTEQLQKQLPKWNLRGTMDYVVFNMLIFYPNFRRQIEQNLLSKLTLQQIKEYFDNHFNKEERDFLAYGSSHLCEKNPSLAAKLAPFNLANSRFSSDDVCAEMEKISPEELKNWFNQSPHHI